MYQENSLQVFAEAIIGGFDMKRKTASMQPKVETLELPSENTERLNSLAKALIKEAIVNNKARKDMYELIDELWNETFLEVYPLEEESDEEKTFREKAKIFLCLWTHPYLQESVLPFLLRPFPQTHPRHISQIQTYHA